jgi:hypothetical protein
MTFLLSSAYDSSLGLLLLYFPLHDQQKKNFSKYAPVSAILNQIPWFLWPPIAAAVSYSRGDEETGGNCCGPRMIGAFVRLRNKLKIWKTAELLCVCVCRFVFLFFTRIQMVGGRRVDAWRQKKWKSENIENITNTKRTAESWSSKRIVESSSSCPLCSVKGRDHSTTLRSGVSGPSIFLLAIYSQKAILRFKSCKIKCFLKFSIARFWPKLKKSPDFYTWFK